MQSKDIVNLCRDECKNRSLKTFNSAEVEQKVYHISLMLSQSWIVSQTSSWKWNNPYNSSYVYFFPAKIVTTNSLEHQVWSGCFWYWDPFSESEVVLKLCTFLQFCALEVIQKIVNLLLCCCKIFHAIYWRIGVLVIFQMHQNTTKWKVEHF